MGMIDSNFYVAFSKPCLNFQ